jgi:predicted GIY-YIG superfamily endonuclease
MRLHWRAHAQARQQRRSSFKNLLQMDFVYLLTPARLTSYRWRASYVGCTNNPARRVRQHNGELGGGALATSSPLHRPWEILVLVSGFIDRGDALTCKFFMRTYMTFC